MNLSKSNKLALGLCLYFVLLACFYAAATPAFEPPDEASHFLYIHNLLETGQLPILEDRQTIAREPVFESQSVQRHHPPLYYIIGALLISGTKRADLVDYLHLNPLASIGIVADNNQNVYLHPVPAPNGDTATAIWILRLYSIALSSITVWLIYRCTLIITDDAHTALIATLLVISIPSFVHISASINNDNLVTMLHTAGIYLCLRMWRKRQISALNIALAGLTLSAVALTKINGLTLFPIMYGAFIVGALTGRFHWRQVLLFITSSLAITVLLAGWWYLRNFQLYGDPLALNATLSIWGRGGAPHLVSLFEAKGIWESFWFTLGYFTIRGPDWLYYLYLPIATVLAVCGLVYAFWRDVALRVYLLFLTGISLLVVLALLVSTSRINVSQGRILFPGMVAFAPLFVIGWRKLFGRVVSGLIVLPLAALTLVTPFVYLTSSFAQASIVDALPANAQPVNISTGKLTVLGYKRLSDTVSADDWVRLTLYIQGSDPAAPYLFVKALYPLNEDILGGIDEYPGMMPTQSMAPDLIYAIPIRFRLDQAKLNEYPAPYQTELIFGWRTLSADGSPGGAYLPLKQGNGSLVTTPTLDGPTVMNSEVAPPPQYPVDVVYGNAIRLSGYTLSAQKLLPGQVLTVTLNWQYASAVDPNWTVAIGLLNAAGKPLATADGAPAGYPLSAWRPGPSFRDTRTLMIPESAAPGNYSLYIGWYHLSDGERLQSAGDNIRDNLFIDPVPLTLCADKACLGTN